MAKADTVLLQDNFNSENGGVGSLQYAGFANWNVTGGVDLIGNGSFDFYPGNGLYVDMNGSPGPGELTSKLTFNLLPGNTYTLQFDLAGSARGITDTVDVSLGSAYSGSFTLPSSQGLTLFTESITVASPTNANLVFDSLAGANVNVGLILDNVLLTSHPSAVPEPGACVLFVSLGLTGAAFLRRKRAR
jgi:hypothetical protein